jgi:uncharacterized protein (TIGR02145 family)
MKKGSLSIISCFIFFLLGITTNAQKVSNITFRQEQSSIIVSYDLETKMSCKISLFVSTDDGKTWQGPLKKVTGDAGNKIVSGNYSITWNVLEEFEELRGDKIKFQVRAEADNMETVIIGTQEWTVKNLDVSRYRNGDIIPEVKDHKKWVELKTGAWCYYNNDPANGKIYGKLYNWYAVNDPRGLAPEGFHVPSDTEWTILTDYLGGEYFAIGKLKETGTAHWNSPNYEATNSTSFTALPGGSRLDYIYEFYTQNQEFNWIGESSKFWSTTENIESEGYSWIRYLSHKYIYQDVGRKIHTGKGSGLSVRCIRD